MSCHDNYPFPNTNPGFTPGGGPPDPALRYGWSTLDRKLGQPESVSFAVKSVNEAKPVWLTIQAFEQRGGKPQHLSPTLLGSRMILSDLKLVSERRRLWSNV